MTMQSNGTGPAHALIAESLAMWHIAGDVVLEGEAVLVRAAGHPDIRIARAPADLPFRWFVTIDGRRRSAVSVVAVLRQLRNALDPGYAMARVRIAALPPQDTQ